VEFRRNSSSPGAHRSRASVKRAAGDSASALLSFEPQLFSVPNRRACGSDPSARLLKRLSRLITPLFLGRFRQLSFTVAVQLKNSGLRFFLPFAPACPEPLASSASDLSLGWGSPGIELSLGTSARIPFHFSPQPADFYHL